MIPKNKTELNNQRSTLNWWKWIGRLLVFLFVVGFLFMLGFTLYHVGAFILPILVIAGVFVCGGLVIRWIWELNCDLRARSHIDRTIHKEMKNDGRFP